jgi:cytochrome c oxidase cbb3-type subunit 2
MTRGVRGTSMPSWHSLQDKTRLAIVQYLKYELAVDRSYPKRPFAYFDEEKPKLVIPIGEPPPPSKQLVARGAEIWQQAKCWECHGRNGKGDGEKAAGLRDDNKFLIPPANLTAGQLKSGPQVRDVFRTITNGLSGTPMPSYAASFNEADRWALAYYVLSLSAFIDPLTQKPLPISERDKAMLDDPRTRAETSEEAFVPAAIVIPKRALFGGDAWARRHGLQLGSPAANVERKIE